MALAFNSHGIEVREEVRALVGEDGEADSGDPLKVLDLEVGCNFTTFLNIVARHPMLLRNQMLNNMFLFCHFGY